jgi:cell division transport system permease protein
MSSIAYAFQEALVNLRRSGRSALMSIGTIAIAFLTLGGFLLASANLQAVVERWASAAEMSVYLSDTIDGASQQALIVDVSSHPAVAGVELVPKDVALERFKSDFPELRDIAVSGENPFPASIEVRLKTDPTSAGAAEALVAGLAERPGVVDVRYDRQWLSRLLAIVTSIRIAGVAIAAVLVLGAAFTVAAVVRLSLEARREEIDIMQLVGAPFAFMRGPSIAEGTLLGGTGAAVSLLVLWGLFVAVGARLSAAVEGLADIGDIRFLGFQDAALLIASGLLVGALAGVVASRVVR